MKKTAIALFVATIFFTSCGDNGNGTNNTATRKVDALEQARLDSLEQIHAVNDSIALAEKFEKEKEIYHKTTNLRNKVIGKNIFDARTNDNYGSPETLSGTDNNTWVTYYADVDITLISDKKTEKIINACVSKNTDLKYDKTLEISKIIGKSSRLVVLTGCSKLIIEGYASILFVPNHLWGSVSLAATDNYCYL